MPIDGTILRFARQSSERFAAVSQSLRPSGKCLLAVLQQVIDPCCPPLAVCLVATLLVALLAACAPPSGNTDVEFRIPVEAAEVVAGTVEDVVVATGTSRTREIMNLEIETPGHLQFVRDAHGRRLVAPVAKGAVVEAEPSCSG